MSKDILGPLTRENLGAQFCSDWLKGEIDRLFGELASSSERVKKMTDLLCVLREEVRRLDILDNHKTDANWPLTDMVDNMLREVGAWEGYRSIGESRQASHTPRCKNNGVRGFECSPGCEVSIQEREANGRSDTDGHSVRSPAAPVGSVAQTTVVTQTETKALANYIADTFFEWDDAEDEASQKSRLTAILESWASEVSRPERELISEAITELAAYEACHRGMGGSASDDFRQVRRLLADGVTALRTPKETKE